MASRIYLIFRDRGGQQHLRPVPVRVETSFPKVSGACFVAGKAAEQAVFVGLPSQREAKILVETVGGTCVSADGALGEGEDGEVCSPKIFGIQVGDSVNFCYSLGVLAGTDGNPSIAAILIGVPEEAPLFCFPHFACQKAQHRALFLEASASPSK